MYHRVVLGPDVELRSYQGKKVSAEEKRFFLICSLDKIDVNPIQSRIGRMASISHLSFLEDVDVGL
jgi:hypothetical protein